MRILQVNDFRDGGGAELVVAETVRLLREAGHEVDLFTGEDVPGRLGPWSYVSNRRAVRALADRVRRFRPDVVHFHNVYHRLSPAVLGVSAPRKILTAHDFHLVCPNAGACAFDAGGRRRVVEPDSLRRAGDLLGRRWDHRSAWHGWLRLLQHLWSYRVRRRREQLDLVLCPGEAAAAMLREAGLPVPVEVVPNPFDAEATRAMVSRRAAERANLETLQLIFVGRVEPEKGLAPVLDVWPSGSARLRIVGDGQDLERCRAIVTRRNLDDCIEFTGRLDRAGTLSSIAAADAVIMPSLTPEVSPMVVLEALALGTPVIAPGTGGLAELLEQAEPGDRHLIDLSPPLDASLTAALEWLRHRRTASDATRPRTDALLEARRPDAYRRHLEAIASDV
ncbi:MAG: glycosyltransferase [Planctomycetota bacterium]